MAHNTRSPFAGFPATRQRPDEHGLPVFTVTPKVLTPARAKQADFLAGLSVAASFLLMMSVIANMQGAEGWTVVTLIAAPFFSYPLFERFWRDLFSTQKRIVMTARTFEIGGIFGSTVIDRTRPHKFALYAHASKRDEDEHRQFQMAQAQRRGRFVRVPRYYSDSWHLTYEDLGQYGEIMTIMGHRDARAVRDRLMAIDKHLDALLRQGDGTALRPDEQWQGGTGDLPG